MQSESGERQRDGQTDIQRGSERQRDTDLYLCLSARKRQRKAVLERIERDIQKVSETDSETGRQRDRQTERASERARDEYRGRGRVIDILEVYTCLSNSKV